MHHPLDLRRSFEIVRRRLTVIWIAAAVGLLAGAGYTALNPPIHESTALVVLPSSTGNTSAEVAIAGSNPVLESALSRIHAVSLQALRSRVHVTNLTTNVISVTAEGGTDAQAEGTANAVADSYVAYIGSAALPADRVPAQVLVAATSATGTRLLVRMLATALLGVVLGAAIGVMAALALGRNDRRLRRRDAIADAIGVPVLASVSLDNPDGTAGWTRLLESYEPSLADAWRLRSALTDLKVTEAASGANRAGSSVTVLSLASDQRALALGPQLAAFAASVGIPTMLVIGHHQDTAAGLALRAAACPPPPSRSGCLRLAVDDRKPDEYHGVLTVVVAIAAASNPQLSYPRPGIAVLAVTAGEVTAAQLARVAARTTANGGCLAGILVGDPDPDDPTTGRFPQLARPHHITMPSRLTAESR